jgi:hypothetical protein
MRLELMHPTETGDHAEVQDAALARLQGVVTPYGAPAIRGQQFLELAIEVVGIGDGPVHILVAQHLAAHGHSAVVQCLVHDRTSPNGVSCFAIEPC